MNNRKETMMRYKIALHQSDEGYSVSIPAFRAVGPREEQKKKPSLISKPPFENISA